MDDITKKISEIVRSELQNNTEDLIDKLVEKVIERTLDRMAIDMSKEIAPQAMFLVQKMDWGDVFLKACHKAIHQKNPEIIINRNDNSRQSFHDNKTIGDNNNVNSGKGNVISNISPDLEKGFRDMLQNFENK